MKRGVKGIKEMSCGSSASGIATSAKYKSIIIFDIMEMYFYEIAQEFDVLLEDVLSIYQLKGVPSTSSKRWQKDNILRSRLGKKFYWVDALVSDVVGTQSLQKAVRIGLFTELSSPSSSIEKLRKVA